jgi:hypothetical protein
MLALWSLYSFLPLAMTAAYKAGRLTDVPPDVQRIVPLMQAQPVWQLVVWALSLVLLLVAGWRLFKGRPALLIYGAAIAINVAGWFFIQRLPEYQQAFTPSELQADYWIIAAEVAVGALIWWLERPRAAPTSAPAV